MGWRVYARKVERGERAMVRRSVLQQIFKEMMNMRLQIEQLEKTFSKWKPQPVDVSNSEVINLPDHLRKTYVAVAKKGECHAAQVSNSTGRCRAIESNYLNQLSRMGWLHKRRISRIVHFRAIEPKYNMICRTKLPSQDLG
jgi:hypothetical protein